jgi:SnoaL-like domain
MPSKPWGCGSRAMSQENVELARRHYAILNAAFASGDLRALERHNAEFLAPDFVCKPAPVFDDTDEMHGHEGALRYTRALMEPFDAVWVQPQEFIESEDRLVVPIRFRGREH